MEPATVQRGIEAATIPHQMLSFRTAEEPSGEYASDRPAAGDRLRSFEPRPFRRIRRAIGSDWIVAGLLFLLDVVSWVSIYAVATAVRGDAFYVSSLQFFVIEAMQLAAIVLSLMVIGGYNRQTEMRGLAYSTEHILAVTGAAVLSFLLVYSAATFDQTMRPSRSVMLLSFVAFLPLSLSYRRAIRGALSASTAGRAFLVVGTGEMAAEFYRAYVNSPNRERLEFIDLKREMVGQHIAGRGSPIIESDIATKLANLSERYSGVIIAERLDQLSPDLLERLVRTQFHNSRVYTLEGFYEAQWKYVPVHSIDPFWPLQMGFQLAKASPYHYAKRLFDVAVAGALLVICSPLLALIALVIWREDGRPVIFRQVRVGRDNEPFIAFKFRTMTARTDKDVKDDDIYTRRNDPRITRVGRWLRKLRFDELPQLWNVLRGEMSLIGPRAEWIRCAERYEKTIPFYHFRHLVKPGITGWAQVNYPYGESDEDAIEKLKYDLYYIRRYSLKLDVMIALKTVHTMLFGKGQ
jgi:exopolysaccharide biosynthesis polyprenyl glycosylphosphotransferase